MGSWDAESREPSSAGKNGRLSSSTTAGITLLLRGKVGKKQRNCPHFGKLCAGAGTMVVQSVLDPVGYEVSNERSNEDRF